MLRGGIVARMGLAHFSLIPWCLVRRAGSRPVVLLAATARHGSFAKDGDGDELAVCRILQFLNRSADVAAILKRLANGSEQQALLGCQVAFDLVDADRQQFVLDVLAHLPGAPAPAAAAGEGEGEAKEGEDTAAPAAAAAAVAAEDDTDRHPEYKARCATYRRVLASDGFGVDLVLNFLSSQNQMDTLILKDIKETLESRNMVLHNATVVTHGYMAAGTTNTAFLRENLEWMGKASNWAKFTATASIGVVHAGHVQQSMALLQPYLPQGGLSTSPFSEARRTRRALGCSRPHHHPNPVVPSRLSFVRAAAVIGAFRATRFFLCSPSFGAERDGHHRGGDRALVVDRVRIAR